MLGFASISVLLAWIFCIAATLFLCDLWDSKDGIKE